MKTNTLFTMLTSAILGSFAAVPAAAQDIVKIAALPYMSQGIISIGITEGYFEAEGITVELIKMRRPSGILPGLMSGNIDLALPVLSAGYFNAISRGGGARIVAPGVTFDPGKCDYAVIYGRKEFSREAIASTDGQDIRISSTPDSFQEYAVRFLNDLPNVGEHNMEFGFVPPHSLADAFKNAALDMALTSEPWITRLDAANVGQVVTGMAEVLPNAQFTFLVFSKRLLEEDPDLGIRAKRAMDAAIVTYNQGKTAQNIEALADYTGLDADLVEQACWAHFPVDGEVHMPTVMAFQAWLKERGLVDEILPAEKFLATVPTK